jgi:hypothetical protein
MESPPTLGNCKLQQKNKHNKTGQEEKNADLVSRRFSAAQMS